MKYIMRRSISQARTQLHYGNRHPHWVEDNPRHIKPGDAIAIPPGKRHTILNNGDIPLRFLCCCAPAYEHDDTVMV